jgi:hypothetical protein
MLFIYVLQLQNDKYYIGKTSNPHFRFDNHFAHNGSEWTKLHKPIKILELIPNCDNYDEDKYTYKYMDKYGIDNVRGGSYTTPILDEITKNQLKKISNSVNNRCSTCDIATDGHFAKDCDINVIKPHPAPAELIIESSKYYINLETLLMHSPNRILINIKDLDIINQLKIYRIKVGDIILNHNKSEYCSLKDLVDDAINIYDNYDEIDLMKIPGISIINIAKEIKETYLLPSKIAFYKNIAELLNQLSKEICELIQSGCNFSKMKSIIVTN